MQRASRPLCTLFGTGFKNCTVALRRQASWGHHAPETLYKYVHASDDRGKTWQHVGLPGPMQWPQIFTCASGAGDTIMMPHSEMWYLMFLNVC